MSDLQVLRELIKSGKVKTKGAYEVMPFDKIGFHKNHSAMIIPMAVSMELVLGVDHEEFIMLHEDKYDFLLRTKVPRNSSLVLVVEGEDIKQQNNCRYYPSKQGGNLVKIMPALEGKEELRRMDIDSGQLVKTCNNIKDFSWKDLDRQYFIKEARKLIEAVASTPQ